MKKIFFVTTVSLLLVSCVNNKTNADQKKAEEAAHIMIPKSGCYAYYSEIDTILLKIEVFPSVVTGILKYQISEKDKNEGEIEGKIDGNKLFADYTFSSEGKTSVREVVFLLNKNNVIEGFGKMKEDNGKMIFENNANIDFSNGIKLTKIDCAENDSKFLINQTRN